MVRNDLGGPSNGEAEAFKNKQVKDNQLQVTVFQANTWQTTEQKTNNCHVASLPEPSMLIKLIIIITNYLLVLLTLTHVQVAALSNPDHSTMKRMAVPQHVKS